MAVECAIVSCVFNEKFSSSYGMCKYSELSKKNIVLKFRAAFDVGKGTIVAVECLQMELPEGDVH